MFNSLSQPDVIPRGKKVVSEMSRKFYESQWSLGDTNKPTNYQSVKNYFHGQKDTAPVVQHTIKREHVNQHQWSIAMTDKVDPKAHFASETRAQYDKPINPQKVGPVRDKNSLMKSQYSLGNEKTEYQTTAKREFYDKSNMKTTDIAPKQKERYDIVNNENISKEKIQQASNFDFYNHEK